MRPAQIFSSVVFPQPLGPTKLTKLPSSTSKLTSRSASVLCVPRWNTLPMPRRPTRGAVGRLVTSLSSDMRVDVSSATEHAPRFSVHHRESTFWSRGWAGRLALSIWKYVLHCGSGRKGCQGQLQPLRPHLPSYPQVQHSRAGGGAGFRDRSLQLSS